ncbi:OmpA family protein [Schleiferiaceae bacterium]|jgi:peptidoglycan-associated lipoprotein|nr:OmpA family protein [Schleiferiaceae bacterium]
MKKALYLFTLLFLLGSTASVFAQDAEGEESKRPRIARQGDAFFDAKEYAQAIKVYKKAYSKLKSRPEKAEIAFRLGECYRYTFQYRTAEAQYSRALKMKLESAEAYLGVAEMLKYQSEYEDALKAYEDFARAFPSDDRGPAGIQSCRDAVAWQKSLTRYQVGNLNSLNSSSHEFGMTFSGRPETYEEVLFTSMREGGIGRKKDGWTGERFSDIYSAERLNADGSSRSARRRGRKPKTDPSAAKVQTFSEPTLLPEAINTEDHEGSPVFDARRRTMYFTRCMDVRRQQLGCAIYSTRKAGLTWQEPQLIVISTDSSKSVGHPAISQDNQTLFFAGDLEGSVDGSKDLWMVKVDKKKRGWGDPINLGALVNTNGDELYPFIHDDGYLYFASNGLPGMGGFDLFRVELGADGMPVGIPENLKAPINSPADDFGILLRPGGLQDGYFVSNRDGGQGGDDIWTLYEVPLKYRISGTLVSSKDNSPLGGAAVKITGNDGFSQVVQTSKDGSFVLESDELAGDVVYAFSFEKKKFLNSGARANTNTLALEAFNYMEAQNVYMHTVEVKAKMDPIEIPIVLPDVYFALAKWDLNDQARAALDTVVKTLTLNPNIVIELRSHTDYRDVDEKNQVLSQHRADTSVSYLISRGIHPDRLVALGMGESQPFEIPGGYKGLGADLFPVGAQLTERNIRKMSASQQEVANQINRRTDFRVIRDDYEPPVDSAALAASAAEQAKEDDKPVIGQMYTVQERDTYTTICRNNKITISDLKRLNGGLRGVRPFPGMVLKVTAKGDYTDFDKTHRQVAVGESFRSIAKDLGMRPRDLEALNPEYEDELPAGTYIRIQ